MSKPSERNYWLDLFTGQTWQEFLDAGGNVTGFRIKRWKTVQRIKKGDYFVCYLTGVSRFIGILEVTSDAYQDTSKIWEFDDFPSRLKVKPVVTLTPETAIPVKAMWGKLSILQDEKIWGAYFRGSPYKWKVKDGKVITGALFEAKENPVERPVDKSKLLKKPAGFKSKKGIVSIPEREVEEEEKAVEEIAFSMSKPTEHTEIQWMLLRLGNEMGLDVWVARNDRNKNFKGKKFSDLPRLVKKLPLQFDEATNKTIELIDVLWLKGKSIVSAFEIECTTSIYSGLLRMADLIAMQPNLNIPLYIVAPSERREKVISEINRPTFLNLSPPMPEICKFIAFSVLREKVKQAESFLSYLKPDFIDEIAEICTLDD